MEKEIFSVRECLNKGNGKKFYMVAVNGRLLGDSRVHSNIADAERAAREYVAEEPWTREFRKYL